MAPRRLEGVLAWPFIRLLRARGYQLIRADQPRAMETEEDQIPPDVSAQDLAIYRSVSSFTMSPLERVVVLCGAARYIAGHSIPGAIVECGVWRGGSMMAVALTLLAQGRKDYDLCLFDTFEGMPPPGESDVMYTGESASRILERSGKDGRVWGYASLEEVREAMLSTRYPEDKIHLVKGRVEETIPTRSPERISLLRLDTDWYESTRHELAHLFPRLSRGGVLIVDDYGHWRGARKALDEFIQDTGTPLFLSRVDYTCRVAIKL